MLGKEILFVWRMEKQNQGVVRIKPILYFDHYKGRHYDKIKELLQNF